MPSTEKQYGLFDAGVFIDVAADAVTRRSCADHGGSVLDRYYCSKETAREKLERCQRNALEVKRLHS